MTVTLEVQEKGHDLPKVFSVQVGDIFIDECHKIDGNEKNVLIVVFTDQIYHTRDKKLFNSQCSQCFP